MEIPRASISRKASMMQEADMPVASGNVVLVIVFINNKNPPSFCSV